MRRPLVISRLGTSAAFAVGVIVASLMSGAGASSPRAAIPSLERCSFLMLWVDEGWWLQIRRNGPAAYGFGALPNRVTVKAGTFTLDEVYRAVIDHVAAPHPDARVTVVFSPMGSGYEGRVFALEGADSIVFEFLATAYRERDRALDDGTQQDAIRTLDPFWTKAPFLE